MIDSVKSRILADFVRLSDKYRPNQYAIWAWKIHYRENPSIKLLSNFYRPKEEFTDLRNDFLRTFVNSDNYPELIGYTEVCPNGSVTIADGPYDARSMNLVLNVNNYWLVQGNSWTDLAPKRLPSFLESIRIKCAEKAGEDVTFDKIRVNNSKKYHMILEVDFDPENNGAKKIAQLVSELLQFDIDPELVYMPD